MRPPYKALTLAIHPSERGFGWVAFEAPFAPYDWGIVWTRGRDKNAKCLKRIERLIVRLSPETLVLERFDSQSRRRERVRRLGRAIVALASAHGVDVSIFSYRDVLRHYEGAGAHSRYEIAALLARQFPVFVRYMPARPTAWRTDAGRQSLFSAVALAQYRYYYEAARLLDGIENKD